MITWLVCAILSLQQAEWHHWADFGEGSSVTFEIDDGMGGKAQHVITLKRKEAKSLLLIKEQRVMGKKFDSEQELFKPEKPATGDMFDKKAAEEPCPKCKKHKFGTVTNGREKVKVVDKELECDWWEQALITCDGKEGARVRHWYAKEVPGWLVKSEAPGAMGGQVRIHASAYTKK